ncbi:MAG: HAMP domain-containing histidine kinase [Acidimicrobiia bacterium]|nr:HAMP domain-containing histidine kinase [Acidimicrobiia bacterium]
MPSLSAPLVAVMVLGLASLVLLIHALRTRRGLHSLQQSVNTIDAYAPLSGESPSGLPPHLEPLAMSIQGMLARFEGERSFERDQLAAACHEIRSPLTALHALTELQMSRRSHPAQPGSTAELELALRNIRRIEDLVNDVLALSLTAHADDPFALWGPVELVSLVRSEAQAHSIPVPVHAEVTTASVEGDPRRLRWAVSNLLANAAEHCSSTVMVEIRSDHMSDERDAIAIRVIDDGAGLGTDDPQRLLLRFRRGSNAIEKSAVSGLGLTIVQSVVDDHGGEVWIEPETDLGGAGFTLVLPVMPDGLDGGTDPAGLEEPSKGLSSLAR